MTLSVVYMYVCECLSVLQSEAAASCGRLFPPESFLNHTDTLGDMAVISLSQLVLNDQPGVDPRWGEGRGKLVTPLGGRCQLSLKWTLGGNKI